MVYLGGSWDADSMVDCALGDADKDEGVSWVELGGNRQFHDWLLIPVWKSLSLNAVYVPLAA